MRGQVLRLKQENSKLRVKLTTALDRIAAHGEALSRIGPAGKFALTKARSGDLSLQALEIWGGLWLQRRGV